MSRCDYCGAEVEFPFQCTYCGKHFCEKHRLLESHDCPNAPARTPLGSYQTKVALADSARKDREDIRIPDLSVTYGNKHGYRFNVPPDVYLDEKSYEKLNEAKTLEEVELIIREYYKSHPKETDK